MKIAEYYGSLSVFGKVLFTILMLPFIVVVYIVLTLVGLLFQPILSKQNSDKRSGSSSESHDSNW